MRPLADQTRRFAFYAANTCQALIPGWWFRRQLHPQLAKISPEELAALTERVDYYCRGRESFTLGDDAIAIRDLRADGFTTYYFDLLRTLRYFPGHLRLSYRFGDIRDLPPAPAIVKSRPILPHSSNAVLMKLNQVRHYVFAKDTTPFRAKSDTVVWRGKCHGRANRIACVEQYHNAPGCDIGDSNPGRAGQVGWKPFMTIVDQLRSKFILSLEGNDVATNLKWIFASNSLCFMPKPRFETWFMEGLLVAGQHYVELRDDLADLLEKRDHYRAHPDEAEAIITNANRHVAQFLNASREHLIGLLVMRNYFMRSGQDPGLEA